MFFKAPQDSKAQVTFLQTLRHLIVFQIKLAADALRDLVMSPVSVLVFVLDALRRPQLEDSYYIKLMWLGRRSDRLINLFDEHREKGNYTVDEAIETVGRMAAEKSREVVQAHRERESGDRESGKQG